jgi:hypothetical protein
MLIKNKKNGTNVLAFRAGIQNVRVPIRAGEEVDIPALTDFEQIINKADFTTRGWFEIVEKKETPIVTTKTTVKEKKVEKIEEVVSEEKETATEDEETNLEKAKKEVKEYSSKTNKENN